MYAQVEKSKENISRSVTNSTVQMIDNRKQGFWFVDNRSEVVTQRKKLAMMKGHSQPTPADNAHSTIQMVAVTDANKGTYYKIKLADNSTLVACYAGTSGNGWYEFTEGKKIHKVHGLNNILKQVSAPTAGGNTSSGDSSEDSTDEDDDDLEMDALSRLNRAVARAEARGNLPELGKRVEAPTPFGMTGISRNRYNKEEPQTTSRKGDFNDAENPGLKYDDWVKDIPWKGFVKAIDSGKPPTTGFTDKQLRASAMVHGTNQYSEPHRMRAAGKVARSAARAKAKGDEHEYSHLFPMAQVGGAGAYDDFLGGDEDAITASQQQIIEDMSSSSDEESEVSPKKRARKEKE